MTESIKESQDAAILSQLIDELNAGQQPKSDDPETAELLAIAALIKKGGPVVRPPQHLLDQTVDKILADQPAKPAKRFRAWLHPGVLGAAASILLVIGFNLSPSWNSSEVRTVSVPAAVMEKREPVSAAKPVASEIKLPVVEKQEAETASINTPIIQGKTVDIVKENAPAPIMNPTVSSVLNTGSSSQKLILVSPDAEKRTPVLREQVPVMTEPASMSKKISIDEQPERWPLPILSLPGRTPDEISSDKKTGVVRQIFWKGTSQEVIVTQRRVWLEEVAAQTVLPLKPELGEEKTADIRSVTIILHNQEVTVEGRRTEQELMKIAKQLIL